MKLAKINHNTLSLIDTIELTMSHAVSFTISDYLDITSLSRKDSQVLNFTITPTTSQIPFIKNESFVTVAREKVDLSSVKQYDKILANEDRDTGQHNYKDSYPYRPRNLIDGFVELKGE